MSRDVGPWVGMHVPNDCTLIPVVVISDRVAALEWLSAPCAKGFSHHIVDTLGGALDCTKEVVDAPDLTG